MPCLGGSKDIVENVSVTSEDSSCPIQSPFIQSNMEVKVWAHPG